MSKRNRSAFVAGGLVAGFLLGVGLALLFLTWAVPEFRNPTYKQIFQIAAGQQDASKEAEEVGQKPAWRYWAERFVGLEDTPAQWMMALFAVLATGVSYYGIRLLKQTLDATREVGRDQTRAYVDMKDIHWVEHNDQIVCTCYVRNSGETPCLRFQIGALVTSIQPGGSLPPPVSVTTQLVGWSGLPGNDVYNCLILPTPTLPMAEILARGSDDFIIISGSIRYQTYLGEWFESEFSFLGRGKGWISDQNKDGTPMSRTTVAVRTYRRITDPA